MYTLVLLRDRSCRTCPFRESVLFTRARERVRADKWSIFERERERERGFDTNMDVVDVCSSLRDGEREHMCVCVNHITSMSRAKETEKERVETEYPSGLENHRAMGVTRTIRIMS